MIFSTQHRWDYWYQDILNAHEVPDPHLQVDLQPYVPVTARIVWATDGEEFFTTHAYAYSGRLVLVEVPDKRSFVLGVWLDVTDAPRIDPT